MKIKFTNSPKKKPNSTNAYVVAPSTVIPKGTLFQTFSYLPCVPPKYQGSQAESFKT